MYSESKDPPTNDVLNPQAGTPTKPHFMLDSHSLRHLVLKPAVRGELADGSTHAYRHVQISVAPPIPAKGGIKCSSDARPSVSLSFFTLSFGSRNVNHKA